MFHTKVVSLVGKDKEEENDFRWGSVHLGKRLKRDAMEFIQLCILLVLAIPLKVWSCPSDCICYKDSLANLESWQWTQGEEIEDVQFVNNEVMRNVEIGVNHEILETVTCIIRSSNLSFLTKIPPTTKILSLLQSEGSGKVKLKRSDLESLSSLQGLKVQGTSSGALSLLPLEGLNSLRFLTLENIMIDSFSNQIPLDHQSTKKILENEIKLMEPKEILPYSEFKKKSWAKLVFNNLPDLAQLRISKCDMGEMSVDMFHNLSSLTFLLLEENELHFLPDFLFYSTPSLARLSLSKNKILSLGTVGLAGLLSLKSLDMSRNNITHLSELSLPPFPLLETADFRFNPIETVFPNTFEVMNSTKTLLIGGPDVALRFYPSSFAGLTSLLHLTLNNVEIPGLEKAMLVGMPNLKFLKMNGKIRKIIFDAFTEVPNLERLILKGCLMKKISMDGFVGLRSLLTLDLSKNKLTSLPPGIFDDQTSLRELYLQENQITNFPFSILILSPLKMVRLDGNPLDCSACDFPQFNSILHVVKRVGFEKNNCSYEEKNCKKSHVMKETYTFEKRVSPICNSPIELKGKTVFQLVQKQLNGKCLNATVKERIEKISKNYSRTKSTTAQPLVHPSPNTVLLNRIEMKLKKLTEDEGKPPKETKNEIPLKTPLSTSFNPLSEIERVEKSLSSERTFDPPQPTGEIKLSKKAKLAKYWKLKQKLEQLRDSPLKRVAQVPL